MKCPKCNDVCRKKMTGAVCLNDKCNWSTHDITKVNETKNEKDEKFKSK